MTTDIYKCDYCEYQSLKKYNLYRHMVSKHLKKRLSKFLPT